MTRLQFYGPLVVLILWAWSLTWLFSERIRMGESKYETGSLAASPSLHWNVK